MSADVVQLPKQEPTDKFHVTSAPEALPGSCFSCNSSDRNWFVDLKRQIEFHGAMYLCDRCLMEMARMLRMIALEDYHLLQSVNEELRQGIFERDVYIQKLERLVDGYRSLAPTDFNPGFSVDSDGVRDTKLQSDPDSNEEPSTTGGTVSSGKEGSSEPSTSNKSGELLPDESSGAGEFSLGLSSPGDE